MRGLALLVTAALALWAPGVARAHHVGTVIPKDTAVSANFKQIKYSLEAGRFDVALTLFEGGALRAEMGKLTRRLPAGLEDGLRAALRAGDARGAEERLMVFMLFLARDLARAAERRIAGGAALTPSRLAQTQKLLEGIWRYYNLVDFVVYQRDVKAALGVRLAYDDAESAAGGGGSDPAKGGGSAPSAGTTPYGAAGTAPAGAGGTPKGGVDPVKAREALRRLSGILTGVIEGSVESPPAVPAGAGATRR